MKKPAKERLGHHIPQMGIIWELPQTIMFRAHRIYVKAPGAKRISETVFFEHKYLTTPTLTHADKVARAAGELYNVLRKKK